jgi:hypothetical protein
VLNQAFRPLCAPFCTLFIPACARRGIAFWFSMWYYYKKRYFSMRMNAATQYAVKKLPERARKHTKRGQAGAESLPVCSLLSDFALERRR